jgi:hypothetical protein
MKKHTATSFPDGLDPGDHSFFWVDRVAAKKWKGRIFKNEK